MRRLLLTTPSVSDPPGHHVFFTHHRHPVASAEQPWLCRCLASTCISLLRAGLEVLEAAANNVTKGGIRADGQARGFPAPSGISHCLVESGDRQPRWSGRGSSGRPPGAVASSPAHQLVELGWPVSICQSGFVPVEASEAFRPESWAAFFRLVSSIGSEAIQWNSGSYLHAIKSPVPLRATDGLFCHWPLW